MATNARHGILHVSQHQGESVPRAALARYISEGEDCSARLAECVVAARHGDSRHPSPSGRMTPCTAQQSSPEPRTRLAHLAEPTGSFFLWMHGCGDSRTKLSLPLRQLIRILHPDSHVVIFRSSQSPSRGESCDTAKQQACAVAARPAPRGAARTRAGSSPPASGDRSPALSRRRPVDARRPARRALAARIECGHRVRRSSRAIGPGQTSSVCRSFAAQFHAQLLGQCGQRKLAGRISARYPAATLLASEPTSTSARAIRVSAVANACVHRTADRKFVSNRSRNSSTDVASAVPRIDRPAQWQSRSRPPHALHDRGRKPVDIRLGW